MVFTHITDGIYPIYAFSTRFLHSSNSFLLISYTFVTKLYSSISGGARERAVMEVDVGVGYPPLPLGAKIILDIHCSGADVFYFYGK